jgi:glyoxylase-like metal-dependent hydrolase (beta-lactamase superfamily II)
MVLFSEQKVLHTGDLVFNKRHPYISSLYEAKPWRWAETVRKWSEKDLVKVIPGHGEPGHATHVL